MHITTSSDDASIAANEHVRRAPEIEAATPIFHWVTLALAAFIAVCMLLIAFNTDRRYGPEELGLYNASYVYEHFGKLAFPAYGYWYHAAYEKLFVHPPTHYLIIALLMRLGLNLYYAEAVPTLAFILISLGLIVRLPVNAPLRLGILIGFGATVGTLSSAWQTDYFFHLRPDAHMAMAWFAGLLTLEHARLRGWDNTRLFWGSAICTYASTVHFSGIFGAAGVGVYLLLALRDLWPKAWWRKAAIAMAGAALPGAPYLFLFFIPNWPEIRYVTNSLQALGGWMWTIRANFALYPGMADAFGLHAGADLLYARPLALALAWSIPSFIGAAVLLSVLPRIRMLALTALPLPLFQFFYSRRKLANYLYPEVILFMIGFWALVVTAAWFAVRKRSRRLGILFVPCLAAGFAIEFLAATPALRSVSLTLRPRVHEMTLARALAKTIVGPHALVASEHGLWYVSGAAEWFDPTKDLLWTVPDIESRTFWRRFDAMAYHNESWGPTSTGMNQATLYRDRILALKGFYLTSSSPIVRGWTWFGPAPQAMVTGYFWQKGTLQRFNQSSSGAYELVTGVTTYKPGEAALAHVHDWSLRAGALFETFLVLPQNTRSAEQEVIFMLLLPVNGYAAEREKLASDTQLLDEVPGTLAAVDPTAIVRGLQDAPIEFPQTHEEVFARYARPATAPSGQPEVARTIPLKDYLAPARGKISRSADRVAVTAPRTGFDWLVVTDPFPVQPESYYLVTYDLGLDRGGAAFYAMTEKDPKPFAALYRDVPQGYKKERFVVYTGNRSDARFVITAFNTYEPDSVSLTIGNPQVLRVTMTR